MVLRAPVPSGAEAVLRDGSHIVVRPIARDDERPILDFLNALSLDSRYLRFFSLSPDLARTAHSAAMRRTDRYGLVACPLGEQSVIGHAGYWTIASGRAEMAVAVADRYQGRGLGRVLLDRIGEAASAHGLRVLEMAVLPRNHAMLNLLSTSRWPFCAQLRSGVIDCELRLVRPQPDESSSIVPPTSG